jgi:hypothetical protein
MIFPVNCDNGRGRILLQSININDINSIIMFK